MSRTDSDADTRRLEAVVAALSRQYEVIREIGRGGMATVYLSTERRHGRSVALKVMHPELTASIGVDRFEREVRIAAGLTHPNILPLFDSGEVGGILFYATPFVEGASLRRRLERTHELPIADAIAIARAVADALGYAHACGFIHRDVTPENILLAGSHPLLADFGIARALGASTSGDVTQSGHVVGSPRYMSPEQATADKLIDGRSDLYSLGCVLFEMLVGAPPYSGDNAMRLMSKHVADPIPATGALRGDVPASLGGLGHTYGLLGRRDEALAVLAEIDRRAEVGDSSAYSRSLVHLGLGDREAALDWIECAAEERSYRLSYLAVEPILDPLRNEPRFIAVQARMGLGNVSRASGAP